MSRVARGVSAPARRRIFARARDTAAGRTKGVTPHHPRSVKHSSNPGARCRAVFGHHIKENRFMPLGPVNRTYSPTNGSPLLDPVFRTNAHFGLTSAAAASQTMEELYFARGNKPAPIALTVGGQACHDLIGPGPFEQGGRGAKLLQVLSKQFYDAFVKAKVPPDVAFVQAFDAACQLGRKRYVEVDHLLGDPFISQQRYRQALDVSIEDNAVCVHKTTTYRASDASDIDIDIDIDIDSDSDSDSDSVTKAEVDGVAEKADGDRTTLVIDCAMRLTGTCNRLEVGVDHVTMRAASTVSAESTESGDLHASLKEHVSGVPERFGFLSRLFAALSSLFSGEPNIVFVECHASDFALADPQAAARPAAICAKSLGLDGANDNDYWVVSASKASFAGVQWGWNNKGVSYGVDGARVVRKDGTGVDPATQRGAFEAFGDSVAARRADELYDGKTLCIGGLELLLGGTPLPPNTYPFGTEHVAAKLEQHRDRGDAALKAALRTTLAAALFPEGGAQRLKIAINGERYALGSGAVEKEPILDEVIKKIEDKIPELPLRRQVFEAIISGRAGMDIVGRGNGVPQFKENTNETCRIDIWTSQAVGEHAPLPGEARVEFVVNQGRALSADASVTLGPKTFTAQQLAGVRMTTRASYSLTAEGPKLTAVQCDGHLKPAPRPASSVRALWAWRR
ncbi:hypothetical protein [Pandoraea oxalativorans]|uniref:Uncharacterized protein n=1 Tax=Pandoraea oxalativorans TaxID=573737 RepID=A0A0G3IDS1_9BURK|nr:hypothetical protein [Pandoraea oxalativorans]AKK24768.1 hypothetical protein MB84_28640 [Pandoraea oxalativorans]